MSDLLSSSVSTSLSRMLSSVESDWRIGICQWYNGREENSEDIDMKKTETEQKEH